MLMSREELIAEGKQIQAQVVRSEKEAERMLKALWSIIDRQTSRAMRLQEIVSAIKGTPRD